MERKRTKIIAIASISVLVVLSSIQLGRIIGNAVSTARKFRKHPSASVAYTLLKGTSLFDYTAKEVMFRPGSKYYERDFRNWTYQPSSMANTWWNRWLIARDAARMDSSERESLLPRSPVPLNGSVLSLIQTDLEHGHTGELSALGLANNKTGERLCSQWVQTHLLNTDNSELFVTVAADLLKCSYSHMSLLFQRYWPQLKPEQRDELLGDVAGNLQENSHATTDLFAWFRNALTRGELRDLGNTVEVLAKFITFDKQRRDATLLVTGDAGELAPSNVSFLLELIGADEERGRAADHAADGELPHSSYSPSQLASALARELIDKYSKVKPQVAVAAFRYVANEDVQQAEQIAKDVLNGPDSELRKGEIVILVENDSVLGRMHIDEAFSGTAPRRTMFRSWYDYIGSSRAADLYTTLARHDYLETGKTWPPTTTKGPLRFDDVDNWRQFITLYPWFSGTDDAYYRMIFSEYMSHDFNRAIQDISEYLHRELPDRDADPYVYYTLTQMALQQDPSDADSPVIRHLRTVLTSPVALMLFDPHPDTTSLSQALDWFLSHKDHIPCLMMNEEQLLIRSKLVALIGRTPFPERLEQADELLRTARIPGVDEILYGPSFDVKIVGTKGAADWDRISHDVMQRAGNLTDGLVRMRANTGEGYTQETLAGITWALLHSRLWGGSLRAAFAASFRSLKEIDADKLPEPLRARLRSFKQHPDW